MEDRSVKARRCPCSTACSYARFVFRPTISCPTLVDPSSIPMDRDEEGFYSGRSWIRTRDLRLIRAAL